MRFFHGKYLFPSVRLRVRVSFRDEFVDKMTSRQFDSWKQVLIAFTWKKPALIHGLVRLSESPGLTTDLVSHETWNPIFAYKFSFYKLPVAKLSIATGHAMQIYNCLNSPRQL